MNQKYTSILEQFFHTEKITDYSLDKIREACEYFGNPQDSFQSIHIAGTNGKGSTAKMIFQILKDAGKRVGVYTSPHNIDIRERFEVGNCIQETGFLPSQEGQEQGGGLISEEDFSRIAEQIIEYGHGLSYFEKCVLLAFLYFHEQECEYAVIEVGMGGRLDATNIITPILSIITSISYDHTEFLGNTLEEISFEKGGIIKQGIPVILYDKNPVLENIAREKNAEIVFPKKRNLETNLLGKHQVSNARIAYEAGKILGLDEAIMKNALLNVDHLGRLQFVSKNLLIDGAHNEDGMKKLKIFLDGEKENWHEIIYCFSLKIGKSISLIFENFSDISDFIIIDTSHHMVEKASNIGKELENFHKTGVVMTPHQVLEYSKKNPEKLFVVFGSLYMIGEFLYQ